METTSFNQWFDTSLHYSAMLIEGAGVFIIIVGVFVAAWRALGDWHAGSDEAYHTFRATMAYAILLGLEFLIAADIIETVLIDFSLESVLVLGLIVLIRTFLSWALVIEIEQRWPWQKESG